MTTTHVEARPARRAALLATAALATLAAAPAERADDGPRNDGLLYFVNAVGRDGPEDLSGVLALDPASGRWRRASAEASEPARVSPDGRRLAYLEYDRGRRAHAIAVVDLVDGRRSEIPGLFGSPMWMADGKSLLVSVVVDPRSVDAFETWRMGPDGSDRVRLPIPETEHVLDVSPDGLRVLAYSSRPAGDHAPPRGSSQPVHVRDLEGGGGDRLVIPGGAADAPEREVSTMRPRFSPDGRRIAYARGVIGGAVHVEVVDIDGGNRRRVYTGSEAASANSVCWSPDGRRLAVATSRFTPWEPNRAGPGPVFLLELDGAGEGEGEAVDRRRVLDMPPGARHILLDWRPEACD